MRFVVLLIFFFHESLQAWGPTGHRIVAELAQRRLNSQSKIEIKKLIGNETLAMVANWPDFIRSDSKYDYTHPWHYISRPENQKWFEGHSTKEGNILEALCQFEDQLRNRNSTKLEKIEALKFFVHLMGDLHQPLHVGKFEDRGGNLIKLKWFDKETNLHAIWDDELIDFQKLSFTEYVQFLEHASYDDKTWVKGDYGAWAMESYAERERVYAYSGTVLKYEYLFKSKELLDRRLYQAGIRLAQKLNAIFNQKKLSNDEIKLREKLKEIKINN